MQDQRVWTRLPLPILHCGIALSCLVLQPGAQTTIPNGNASPPGNAISNLPFGEKGEVRAQYLYEASTFASSSVVIHDLGVITASTRGLPGKRGLDLEIRMSTSPRTVRSISSKFAQNPGQDEVTVFRSRSTNLPPIAGLGRLSLRAHFKLDRKFLYRPAKGSLLIEYRVKKAPAGSYTLYQEQARRPFGRLIGHGCMGIRQRVSGNAGTAPNSTLVFEASGLPANSMTVHVLDLVISHPPRKLSTGCTLYINPFAQFRPVTRRANGTAEVHWPSGLLYLGSGIAPVFGQFVSRTQSRMLTSDAHRVDIRGIQRVASVVSRSLSANTGKLDYGTALVHQLR